MEKLSFIRESFYVSDAKRDYINLKVSTVAYGNGQANEQKRKSCFHIITKESANMQVASSSNYQFQPLVRGQQKKKEKWKWTYSSQFLFIYGFPSHHHSCWGFAVECEINFVFAGRLVKRQAIAQRHQDVTQTINPRVVLFNNEDEESRQKNCTFASSKRWKHQLRIMLEPLRST